VTTTTLAADAGAGRPRRWWIAFLLNVLLPPAGYAYAGAWLTAAMTFLVVVMVPMILLLVTNAYPPGIYGLGQGALFAGGVVAVLALGAHAAWVAAGSPPKTGPQMVHAWVYLATWVAGFSTNLLLQLFWPNPTYVVMADSMAPTLKAGDVLMVDGPRAFCGHTELQPGQVVLFRRPGGNGAPQMLRIVAGPGQFVSLDAGRPRIDGRVAAQRALGTTRIDNVPVPATVVQETLPGGAAYRTVDLGSDADLDTFAPTKVPAGSWFLLGDNRDNTADSRTFGPVSGGDICAVGLKVIASREASRVGQAL
jgi:signal peptidase I